MNQGSYEYKFDQSINSVKAKVKVIFKNVKKKCKKKCTGLFQENHG